MCSIAGVLLPPDITPVQAKRLDEEFARILRRCSDRGRDSYGVFVVDHDGRSVGVRVLESSEGYVGGSIDHRTRTVIANCRAEPTTEWVRDKTLDDVQPYRVQNWAAVHNGTIANDHDLIERFGFEPATSIDSVVLPHLMNRFMGPCASAADLGRVLRAEVVGSYALAAVNVENPGVLLLAANYKPIYLRIDRQTGAVFFASQRHHLAPGPYDDVQSGDAVTQVEAYSALELRFDQRIGRHQLVINRVALRDPPNHRVLVVCSGGLDSTAVAAMLDRSGMDVTLLHFDYGCRATGREIEAVRAISERTGWPLMVVPLGDLFTHVIGASPLTAPLADGGQPVNHEAGGIAGAEFAHEWVPARNLIMLSIATGIAEAHGFDTVALGNNLEESGAYPDNEMEFVTRLNGLMPFAVGSQRRVNLLMPVGHMMKREIIAAGARAGAPFDLTWSCYHGGERHCGECGPCFMRQRGFDMNDLEDPVFQAVPA